MLSEMLTSEARDAYLIISYISWENNIISWNQFLKRLSELRKIVLQDKVRIINVEDDDRTYEPSISEYNCWSAHASTEVENLCGIRPEENNNFPIRLILQNSTGLHEWQYHLADADPFPSVPHGHFVKTPNKKLDVYHGYIYDNKRVSTRQNRQYIIQLWNNKDFREFAIRAIDYFIKNNRKHVFSVPNPRKLPGK